MFDVVEYILNYSNFGLEFDEFDAVGQALIIAAIQAFYGGGQ
jgi:hypothetical protein